MDTEVDPDGRHVPRQLYMQTVSRSGHVWLLFLILASRARGRACLHAAGEIDHGRAAAAVVLVAAPRAVRSLEEDAHDGGTTREAETLALNRRPERIRHILLMRRCCGVII